MPNVLHKPVLWYSSDMLLDWVHWHRILIWLYDDSSVASEHAVGLLNGRENTLLGQGV